MGCSFSRLNELKSKLRIVYGMMRLTFLPNVYCNYQTYFYNDKKTNTPTVKATYPCEHTPIDSLAFHY